MHADLRERRRAAYLDAATRIVLRDGLDGLTMNAIAREVDAAVGTVYGYFSSKSALLAELQIMAIERITAAWGLAFPTWRDDLIAGGVDRDELALASVAVFGEFFIELQRVLPEEFQLQQMQLGSHQERFEADEMSRLLPAAVGMLRVPFELIAGANAAGALDAPDEAAERSLEMVFALNGVALAANLQMLSDLVSLTGLTRRTVRDLLVGWGADRTGAGLAVEHARRVVSERDLATLVAPAGG